MRGYLGNQARNRPGKGSGGGGGRPNRGNDGNRDRGQRGNHAQQHDDLPQDDPFDSEEAVDGSARYLAEQLRRFRSVRLAVAAYNAGPGLVGSGGAWPDETRVYVEQVTERYARRRRVQAHR